jgi:hypothetical protein
MKRVLVVTVLALLLMSTVGVGAVAAKQYENPSHAGKSSIYFYDVAASDTHGKGKLEVDVDKHTFVFNGQDFEPSAQIALRARAADSTDYVIFATGKATPSGNLHIAGTWETGAAVAEVVAGTWYPPLYGFCITNYGGFVAQLACYYSTDGGVTWHESDHINGISLFETVDATLGELGVPENALVKIHIEVVGGKDRTGSEVFQHLFTYCWEGQHWASYTIKGTTWNPKLVYDDYYPPGN